MMIYKIGNILDSDDSIIAHGCNSRGVMDSGVAKAIRDKYPVVYQDYMREFDKQTSDSLVSCMKLGTCILSNSGSKTIISCITQKDYGLSNIRYVSYDAVDLGMARISGIMNELGKDYISIPKIGSGLGNGDWNVIVEIISSRLKNKNVTVWDLS